MSPVAPCSTPGVGGLECTKTIRWPVTAKCGIVGTGKTHTIVVVAVGYHLIGRVAVFRDSRKMAARVWKYQR